MKLSEYDISNPFPARLLTTERITPLDADAEVRHIVFEAPQGKLEFVEGQSVGVLAPGPHEFGNPYHLRLYSIASPRSGEAGRPGTFSLCVRRCFSIDEISGERYPGKASNYLCDARPGEIVQVTGPYGAYFNVPPDDSCNMLMVGTGTGIAPFRAFVRHIYSERGGWKGNVRLFYGARSGMELLYFNDLKKDLALYYDVKSFRAFEAISPRPHFDDEPALDRALLDNAREVWEMIQDPKTYVYVAGLVPASKKFERAMVAMARSETAWREQREELVAQNRYAELLYE